ncbi:MAG: hypothetical protein K2I43_06590 [Alistipes sp.]|nr:hypothetical protein [Alistipes sp.]
MEMSRKSLPVKHMRGNNFSFSENCRIFVSANNVLILISEHFIVKETLTMNAQDCWGLATREQYFTISLEISDVHCSQLRFFISYANNAHRPRYDADQP